MFEIDRSKLFLWALPVGFIFSFIAAIFMAVGFEWAEKIYTTKWDWFKFMAITAGGLIGQAVALLFYNLFGLF